MVRAINYNQEWGTKMSSEEVTFKPKRAECKGGQELAREEGRNSIPRKVSATALRRVRTFPGN